MANDSESQVILYQTDDGKTKLQVEFDGDTAWLSQNQMAELFETTKQNISLHISNIYKETELSKQSTVKDSLTVQIEGGIEKKRSVEHYNLDFAELQATRGRAMSMKDWTAKLDQFLETSDHELLTNAGSVSAEVAAEVAQKEFRKYKKDQNKNLVSDFDQEVKKYSKKK